MRMHAGRSRSQEAPSRGRGGPLRSRTIRGQLALVAVAAVVLSAASLAFGAEELTRSEYRDRVEPICKRNSEANREILKGIHAEVRQGKLDAAGRRLIRAAVALRHALTQLKAVPRPPADEARLTEWLKRVAQEAELLQRAGNALKAGKQGLASRLQARLYAGANSANSLVLPFDFRYCRFEPSKYL